MDSKNKIWFDEKNIYCQDELGEVYHHALQDFPKLLNAKPNERLAFEVSPFGIHWVDLDEDLSFEGFKESSKLVLNKI